MDDVREKLADLKLGLVNSGRDVIKEKILDQAPCIVADVESGTIIFASKRVSEIFGMIYNEIEGKLITDLMPESYRKRHDSHLSNYSKAPSYRNMGAHGMTLKGMRKGGSEFDIKISLEPFIHDQKIYVLATIFEV
jgi:PAS domain S-box-containing protein